MNKTNVDNMLIEMITPKVKEIEEKFSRGEGLEQEDINTLLLKSQYNHINHLDEKLNEVTDSVKALEGKFLGLEGKFELQKQEIKADIAEFKYEVKTEIANLKIYIEKTMSSFMKWFIGGAGILIVLLKLIDKVF